MYDIAKVTELATKLADKLSNVRPAILGTSIYGQSNAGQLQQDLRREASELVHGLNSGWERQAVVDQLAKMEGVVQNAAAIGLLQDNDLQRYLGMIDNIYVVLDQKN